MTKGLEYTATENTLLITHPTLTQSRLTIILLYQSYRGRCSDPHDKITEGEQLEKKSRADRREMTKADQRRLL